MSDFNNNNRDPLNPGGFYDQYGNSRYEPVDSGRGAYVLLAILVAIGVIGGLLYFNHKPIDANQAQAPAGQSTTTGHVPGAPPISGAPATPNNPGGMAGPSAGGAAGGAPTPTPSGGSTH